MIPPHLGTIPRSLTLEGPPAGEVDPGLVEERSRVQR